MSAKCNMCGSDRNAVLLRDGLSYYSVIRCESCGLAFAAPQPSPDEIESFYKDDYTYFTPQYEKSHRNKDYKKALQVLGEIEEFCSNGHLLDVGSAVGTFLSAAQDRGWEPEGLEISEDASRIARQRGFLVHSGSIEDVSIRKDFYDVVTMMDSLEHVRNPLDALRKINLSMRRNGLIVIETPNFASIYRRLIGRRWVGFNKYHLFFFTPDSISAMLAAAGLKVLRLNTTNADLISRDSLFRWGMRDAIAGIFRKNTISLKTAGTTSAGNFPIELTEKALNLPFSFLLNKLNLGDQIRVYARKTG